ncbi:hypothetical protein [Peribacillus simplex]
MFFTFYMDETLDEEIALLPNYWLAETPQPLGEEAWQAVGGKGVDF